MPPRHFLACALLALLLSGCAGQPPAPATPAVAPPPAPPAATVDRSPAAAPPPAKPSITVIPPAARAAEKAALDEEFNIFFSTGDLAIDPDDIEKLERHAQRLRDNPKLRLTLVGHADDQGSRSYKLAVAEQRVQAVYRQLLASGAPRTQLRRYPVGKEKPGMLCHRPDCREKMRRVELIYRK